MPDHPHHSASDSARWREIVLLRRRLVSLKAQTRLLRHELARKYNPDQPRVPAGDAGGGQWTSGGGGGNPTLTGTDWLGDLGSALSTALSFSDVVADTSGDESWAFYQDATRPDGSLAERAVVNRDGSTIQSEFAEPGRQSNWEERHTITLPEGGKTTFETSERTQTIRDGGPDGEVLSRSTWTERGPEREATVQQAFAPPNPAGVAVAGAVLFGWLSPGDDIDGPRTVMGFVPRDYQSSKPGQMDLAFVGNLTTEEAKNACHMLGKVQELTDRAADAAGDPRQFSSMATYGTDVHVRFKNFVNDLNDINFRAERSFLKEAAEPTSSEERAAGYPRSVRTDAYEYRPEDGTLCVYDLKAGRRGLSVPRSDILATAAYLGMSKVRRVILLEVRPRR
ncbi:hypothetical protein QO058_12925 [Bosea vestrisii]|uniref:hypothetical protein n=1 Tax=Bosea vestrisii TaxID=151416 RepID=UPI0024DF88FC|nr:hypothetical protein [Bosea vestrisii]WID99066.1 hypothetical protein QO058_12925 [Bosea vestrisii]